MIVRLVKLSFRENEIDGFLSNFEVIKSAIRNFNGCHYLELLRDEQNPSIFFTHSHWESNEALQSYRHSDFFKNIWAETKSKFDKKPEAWSTNSLEKLL